MDPNTCMVARLRQILELREERIQTTLATNKRRTKNWEQVACVITQCKLLTDIKPEHVDRVDEFCEFRDRGKELDIDIVQLIQAGFSAFSEAVLKATDEQVPIYQQLASRMAVHSGHYAEDRYFWESAGKKERPLNKVIDIKDRKELHIERLLDSHNTQLAVLEERGYTIIGGRRISDGVETCLLSEKEIVSAGGYGCVYRAHSKKHNRDIAMKLSKIMTSDLSEEAANIRDVEKLGCKRFVKLLAIEEIEVNGDLMTVLILPWYKRGSLSSYCTMNKLFPPMQALVYYRQMLESLAALDSDVKKFMHRDIKPDNFLLEDDMSGIILIDFGVSREETERNTATNNVGTMRYIAPEVINSPNYDCKADCYSAGVTLHQMLTGEFTSGKWITERELNLLGVKLQGKGLSNDCIVAIRTILEASLCDRACRHSAKALLSNPKIKPVLENASFELPKPVVAIQEVPVENKKVANETVPDVQSPPTTKPSNGGIFSRIFGGIGTGRCVQVDQKLVDSCGGPDNDAFVFE